MKKRWVRIFIVPTQDTPDEDMKIFNNTDRIKMGGDNWLLSLLVKSIMISPNCTQMETEMIEKMVKEITNGAIKCSQSKLYNSFDPVIVEP